MSLFNKFLNLIVVVAIFVPTIVIATDYVVGDDKGWTNNGVDYEAWAKDKDFKVGDALVFNYKAPNHNVYKVDGAGFTNCNTTSANGGPLTTGNDRVELQTAGNKWYICGKEGHCGSGQKLKISVKESSSYNSAVHGIIFSGLQVLLLPLTALFII